MLPFYKGGTKEPPLSDKVPTGCRRKKRKGLPGGAQLRMIWTSPSKPILMIWDATPVPPASKEGSTT